MAFLGIGHNALCGRFLLGLGLVLGCGTVLSGQVETARWVDPISGNWDDPSRWSTDVYPTNDDQREFEALIDAAGEPYFLWLNRDIWLNELTIASSSASLDHQQGQLTIGGRLDLQAGGYRFRGGSIVDAVISTGSESEFIAEAGSLVAVSLEGELTLRNRTNDDGILVLRHQTRLDGGRIRLAGQNRPAQLWVNTFPDEPVIAGSGEILFDGNETAGRNYTFGIAQIVAQSSGSYVMTIDPGIAIRTGSSSGTIRTSGSAGQVLNRGLISAETADRTIRIEAARVRNEGTLQAINGGSLHVNNLIGDAGEVILGSGSSMTLVAGSEGFMFSQGGEYSGPGTALTLFGPAHVSEPLAVRDGATLSLTRQWTTSAAITASDGATLRIGGEAFEPQWVTATDTHVVVGDPISAEALATLNVGGNRLTIGGGFPPTTGSILNHGRQLDLADWQGDVMVNGGTINGGSVISSDGSAIRVQSGFGLVAAELDVTVDLLVGASLSANLTTGEAEPFINRGIIRGPAANAAVSLYSNSHNEGTIELVNGSLTTRGRWSNTGTIDLRGGTFDMGGAAEEFGSISLEDLDFMVRGQITTEQLRDIDKSNVTMYLGNVSSGPLAQRSQGELINTGETFDVNQQTGRLRLQGGHIIGGTFSTSDGTVLKRELGTDPVAFHNVTFREIDLLHEDTGFGIALLGTTTLDAATFRIEAGPTQSNQAGGLSFIRSSDHGESALTGKGEVVFGRGGTMNTVRIGSGGALNVGPQVAIRTGAASGRVSGDFSGSPGYGQLINQGSVTASGSGRQIEIVDLDGLENTGTLEAIDGGHLLINGTGVRGMRNWGNDGSIRLDDGTVTVVGEAFTNNVQGQIIGTGTLNVSETTFVNHGTISPGLSPGRLTIVGGIEQSESGRMLFEIAGTTAGDLYDQLVLTDNASLSGEIVFSFIDGFAPSEGDLFHIIEIGEGVQLDLMTDAFTVLNLLPGFEFEVGLSGDHLAMTALNDGHYIPEPAGLALLLIAGAALLRRRTHGR